ncbi:hypothetical protein GCM10027185_62180 [Spirosoma pulveris]
MNRRIDPVYMDSLAALAKKQNRTLTVLPKTPGRDSLRLKSLYYLGRLSLWRDGNRDSTLYYGNELIRQARASRNVLYEIAGKVLLEGYYHPDQSKTREAIQLNLEILSLLPDISFLNIIKYRTRIKLSKLYARTKDHISELRFLAYAKEHIGYLSLGVDTDLREYIKTKGYDRYYVNLKSLRTFLLDIDQLLGASYLKRGNMIESEKYYLAADTLLKKYPSKTVQLFIYNAIGDLYFTNKRYKQALAYAKKAAGVVGQSQTESENWSTQACEYASMGQDTLAYQFAQKALKLLPTSKISNKLAYMALYQVAEHRQERKNGEQYYTNYMRLYDTLTVDQANTEINFIEDQAVYDELTLDRNLQISKLIAIDMNFLYIILGLVFGLLLLLIYSLRLRKRRTEANRRLLEEREESNVRIVQTQAAERQRLARDLHDDMGSYLSSISILSQSVVNLAQKDPAKAHALVQKIGETARQVMDSMGDIIWSVNPDNDAMNQVAVRMRDAGADILEGQNVIFHLDIDETLLSTYLPIEQRHDLFLIYREALTNCAKYAQATHVWVRLQRKEATLILTVQDDGLGFDQRQSVGKNPLGGNGLKNMRARAEKMGGTFALTSVPGQGTTIFVQIKLR